MPNKDADKKTQLNNYLKFSSIAIQMAILVVIGAFSGQWLDEKQGNTKPIWTLILTLIAIFASLYQVIRGVIKMSKSDEDGNKG